MTILRIINRGVDRATYSTIVARVNIDQDHPLGLIMHGASEADDTVQVAQIWESGDYMRQFDEERLNPVLQAVGARIDDVESTIFELHHLITP